MLVRSSIGTLARGGRLVRRLPSHAARRRATARARRRALLCDLCFAALPEDRGGGAQRARPRERAPARGRPPRRLSAPADRQAAPVRWRRHARGHRLDGHLGAPRGRLRLRLRPRAPARLYRPLPARTTGSRARTRWARARPLASCSRRRSRRSTPSSRSSRATARGGSSRSAASAAAAATASVAVYDFTQEARGRHARGADHLQRAGHRRRPLHADRRRRLGPAQDRKALDRLQHDLRGAAEAPLKRVTIAGYEARQGAPLRRADRHGPGRPPDAEGRS